MVDICGAEFPDDTSPVDIEGGVSDRNDEKNEKILSKKRQNSQMTLPLLRWRKVQVIENMKKMKKMMGKKRQNSQMTLPLLRCRKV